MKFPYFSSSVLSMILVIFVAFFAAIELYELFLQIERCTGWRPLAGIRVVLLFFILWIAFWLRSIEVAALKQKELEKERYLQDRLEDVSEKLAEEKHLLHQYKEAIDKSAIVSKTDKKGVITFVNDNFCKVSGYSREELIGNTHALLRHPQNSREFFKKLWLTILSKKVFSSKIRNIKKNGEEFWVSITIVPILSDDNEIDEFMAIMFDITKEKQLEEKLLKTAIKEQEKMHELELRRAKESFLLVFTHELKTPLNAIINFSSFAQKKVEKADFTDKQMVVELLAGIKRNGEDMLIAVTNMLDTAKLQSKKMVFVESRFELGTLIKEVVEKIVPKNEVSVELSLQKDVYLVYDRLRIEQIISNIISNGVKYGLGKILITLNSSGDSFMLCIEDNGYGIKDKEGIFKLFGSDNHETTRSAKGTGIGLYFAKMLCDEFGLIIALEDSNKLGGCRFCIYGSKERKVG